MRLCRSSLVGTSVGRIVELYRPEFHANDPIALGLNSKRYRPSLPFAFSRPALRGCQAGPGELNDREGPGGHVGHEDQTTPGRLGVVLLRLLAYRQ